MKPLRITLVLLALLVVPLFATQVLADFNATLYDVPDGPVGANTDDRSVLRLFATQALADFMVTLYDVPDGFVGANTDNREVIGFIINGEAGNTLDRVKVRSYIERAYATERVKLWREDGTTAGFQKDEDVLLKSFITSAMEFDINEEITFLAINYVLPTNYETFYITLDINTSVVNANPGYYHETGLEVTLEPGYIVLQNGEINSNAVRNPGWYAGPPPFFNPYTLIFDTQGPYFDLHFCIEDNSCSTYAYYDIEPYIRVPMVDHEDRVRICATNVDPNIMGDIHVIGKVDLLGYVSSLHMFGVSPILLTDSDSEPDGCSGWCNANYNTIFQIPDVNDSQFKGVDADTGDWYVCAWAQDSFGNVDTICIGHEDLVYRIDTQDPIIDSITWEHVYDWNSDGKIGLGDSIMIIGWGLSNPIRECATMEVDWSWSSGVPNDWRELDDVLENNRIFRKVFGLTDPLAVDSTDCEVNFLVRAWDNACNWDTLRGEICGTIDLWPPDLEVEYLWYTDYDTMWACIGIGDEVLIRATVGGTDIVSVTAMMDSAGIDENMQHAMPLPHRGGGVYDTVWTVTEPPIKYGKDRDNTEPPDRDDDYRVWVTACDDVGNCVTEASNVLNKTLDTRCPRPIGFACPDSVPCALHARPLSGGIIELYWDQDCDEDDAFFYYVWASFEGTPFELIGATNVSEQTDPDFYFWRSEPLPAGCWWFKIKTDDNCSNVGPFSCVVSTPIIACKAFLTPSKLNLTRNAEHTFMIHLHPCESTCASEGDSAQVYVDVDGSCTFDSDERYPAVVNSPSMVVKVYCPDLVDNDPKVVIYSVNNIPISDTLGNDIVMYLDTFTPKGKGPKTTVSPDQFNLSQNYPNPFNPACEISYALPTDCQVTLIVYNLIGQKVRVLVDEYQNAGNKSVKWNGTDDQGREVTSGVYFYRIQAGDFVQSKKMVLMK